MNTDSIRPLPFVGVYPRCSVAAGQAVGTFWNVTADFLVYDASSGRVSYISAPEAASGDTGVEHCCSPSPSGINDSGQIAGFAFNPELEYGGFTYSNGVVTAFNGLLPFGINDSGQIAGTCFPPLAPYSTACLYHNGAGDLVRILKPNDGRDDFNFETREFAGEGKTGVNIPVQGLVPTGRDIRWEMNVDYTTSGGIKAFNANNPYLLTTASEQEANMRVEAAGGKVQITATAVAGTIAACPAPIHGTVTGFYPSKDDIVAMAADLYKSPTPKLLVGIASRESTFMQFCTPMSTCMWKGQKPIYGRPGPWPVESYATKRHPGGSHIGLMQVDLELYGMPAAWDWRANLTFGRKVFGEKLSAALSVENKIRSRHPGLSPLTVTQREAMALCLYGEGAPGRNPDRQYYKPLCTGQVRHDGNQQLCEQGNWTWGVNTAGNATCVEYADDVRERAGRL